MNTSTMDLPSDIQEYSQLEVINRIIKLNEGIAAFWSSAHGWAPMEAAELLSKSRLDRQVSISKSLVLWEAESDEDSSLSEGKLIFAWVNLGALIEGTLKWFLSVYYEDYKADINSITNRSGKTLSPDGVMLQSLRLFFKESVWADSDSFDPWIERIQSKRNAIHTYKHREIGDWSEYEVSVKEYLYFLRSMESRVPYPEGGYYASET